MKGWNLLQKMNLVLGIIFLVHAVGGMVVNPDFAVGSDATSQAWLLMDWNGWHALSGILLWSTAIAVSFRRDLSRLFAFVVVGAQIPVIIWMLFDPRPLGLFVLPTTGDLLFHSSIVAAYAIALATSRRSAIATA